MATLSPGLRSCIQRSYSLALVDGGPRPLNLYPPVTCDDAEGGNWASSREWIGCGERLSRPAAREQVRPGESDGRYGRHQHGDTLPMGSVVRPSRGCLGGAKRSFLNRPRALDNVPNGQWRPAR